MIQKSIKYLLTIINKYVSNKNKDDVQWTDIGIYLISIPLNSEAKLLVLNLKENWKREWVISPAPRVDKNIVPNNENENKKEHKHDHSPTEHEETVEH